MSKRILIVDDEIDLSELLAYNLERSGYQTKVEHNGRAGLESARTFSPDLVVLDVMMPELTGTEVAARLKREDATASIPIIMLTAKSEEGDELEGLTAGADDYVTKPFSMKVLEARIQAILRRVEKSGVSRGGEETLSMGRLVLDRATHEATLGDERLSLTNTEFRLLQSLLEAEGRVLSRQSLINRAMGPGVTVTERTIDVHVTSIRKKLGEDAAMVKTVRGVGYRLVDEQTAEA